MRWYLILSFWLGSILPVVAQQTIEVCPTCPFSSIQEGIDTAAPHSKILIKEGIYNEHDIQIKKPLTLLGTKNTIIDAQEKGEIITVLSDSVTIENLTIRNTGISYIKDIAGISTYLSKNCTIRNNKIENTLFGIYLKKSSNCVVDGNEFLGKAVVEMSSGNAIHLWHCDSILIQNNKSIQHRDGIYLEFVKNSTIQNNLSKHNVRYGLHFMFSDNNIYRNNIFEENGSGVAVMYSTEIQMIDNKFINNWGAASYGILLKEITDGSLIGNTFYHNTTAIYGEGATRMKFENNIFKSNGWAMKILSSCMENTIRNNVFELNSFSVFTNSPRNYNLFEYNYWDDYKGYDLDKNGIGDVPHRPINLFTYIVEKSESAILLMRSNFIGLLEIAEKAAPSIIPESLVDEKPRMKPTW